MAQIMSMKIKFVRLFSYQKELRCLMRQWSMKVDRLYLDEHIYSVNTDEIKTQWGLSAAELLDNLKDMGDLTDWYLIWPSNSYKPYFSRYKREGSYPID